MISQSLLENMKETEDMTDKTPIEFFNKLVTPEIIEEMIDKTNLYAQKHFEEHPEVSH